MDFLPARRPSIRALFISTNCLDNRAFPDLVHTAAASNTYNFIEFFMLSMKHYSLIIKIPTIFEIFTKKISLKCNRVLPSENLTSFFLGD